jgi:hypothetical protein
VLPSCSYQTFCGFFLAALGAAMGWGFGGFIVVQITRAIAWAIYGHAA